MMSALFQQRKGKIRRCNQGLRACNPRTGTLWSRLAHRLQHAWTGVTARARASCQLPRKRLWSAPFSRVR
jgi:hypothetical protein